MTSTRWPQVSSTSCSRRNPFQYDGAQAKERGLSWTGVERDEYPTLTAFLDRATDPDPENRFASVANALAVCSLPHYVESQIEHTGPTEVESIADQAGTLPRPTRSPSQPSGVENEVEWLKSLLQSYPGSRWATARRVAWTPNSPEKTYRRDQSGASALSRYQERCVNLVVLCGNAGDGKTALLQRLAKRLGLDVQTSATRILEGRLNDGLNVRMNLDGSASWQGRSADDLLDEFLAPFQGRKASCGYRPFAGGQRWPAAGMGRER